MSLLTNLTDDTKQALKESNKAALLVLRGVQSAIKNEMIAQKLSEANDDMVLTILKREVKKRNEAIKLYQQGGRDDLVKNEKAELEILSKYLPPQMSVEDINIVIDEVISSLADQEPNFGMVMKMTMTRLAGQADGSQVSALVKNKLS